MNNSNEAIQKAKILALPLELLCQVFQHLQDSEPGGYSRETPELGEEHYEPVDMPGHSWRAAREVCRTWQQAIDGYQRFWTTIGVGRQAEAAKWVKHCIDRSRTLDLRLQFFAGQQMDEVCDVLLPVRGRIKAIEVFNARTIRALRKLQRLFNGPLDHLAELKIQFDWRGGVDPSQRFVLDEEIKILPQNVPALGTLDLRGVHIPWDSEILKKLHTLSLWGWTVDPDELDSYLDFSLKGFLKALKACQSLQRLTLMLEETMSHIICTPGKRYNPIHLPKLQSFSLHVSKYERDIALLVEHLHLPENCDIRVSAFAAELNDPAPTSIEERAKHFLWNSNPVDLPILGSADWAIWNGPKGFECRSRNGRQGRLLLNTCFPLIIKAIDVDVMVDAFCRCLRHASLRKLILRWPLQTEQYKKVFRTFPSLEELSVECGYERMHTTVLGYLFDALWPRTVSGPVLPRLRNLQLVGEGIRRPELHQRFHELVKSKSMQIQQAAQPQQVE